ncbi:hypothetical protein MJO28_010618 [Puccinia striiformis f. sp. tritici]|uniref:Uncharacterized protein n=1 Tax=Puccinia striiformis f. sp. tritici TaxID=168172 RepID=A0ACC0E550_9BASI|nr:hypothetical protein MJO28_010618 [Puccinia striiformis f. sp. tritici]
MVVVKEISNLVQKSDKGWQVWATFIQDEASDNPLRDMMHSLHLDTGAAIFSQSHKNIMTTKSLNLFLQMANNFNIIDQSPATNRPNIKKVDNSYIVGLQKIKIKMGNNPSLSQFKLHMLCDTGLGDNDDEEMTQPVVESTGYEL